MCWDVALAISCVVHILWSDEFSAFTCSPALRALELQTLLVACHTHRKKKKHSNNLCLHICPSTYCEERSGSAYHPPINSCLTLQVGLKPAGDAEEMVSRHVKKPMQTITPPNVFETANDKESIEKASGEEAHFLWNFCSERLKPKSWIATGLPCHSTLHQDTLNL